MTTDTGRAMATRIQALVVVGVALTTAGLYSIVTLLYSILARYMHVEDLDLGLDESTMFAVTRMTSVDRGIIVIGGILMFLGAAALIAAAVRERLRRRRAE